MRLTQTIKHKDKHGKLLSVEIRAVLGEIVSEPGSVRIERVNGTLRDRLNALTRKTHAFAKRDAIYPLTGSLAAFSPRRLPPAHPPGLLQPRKPQPAHWLQPWSGAWHWPARHWRIRRQRARLPLQRRRRGTDRHLLTRTAARDSMAGDEYATGDGWS